MIRVALLTSLLLLGGTCLTAQKKGEKRPARGSVLAKEGLKDPYTAEDPKLMEKLGVVGYGPLVWANHKRTTDIDKVLGEGRILWMETEHFKIGCNLGFAGAPKDSVARRQLKAEMKRLNKKCRKIPASKGKMGPWLRLHIYAQRAEDLLAEFSELSGHNEPGKQLGQKEKLLLLLFEKKSDLARYMDVFGGRKTSQTQRLYHAGGHYSLVLTAQGDDGPRDSETVNAQFRFFLIQMFCDAANGAPFWLSYGMAHWYERQIPCNMINCGVKANESVDRSTQYQWDRKMLKRSKHDALLIPFAKLCSETDLGFYGHVQAWSLSKYLMEDKEKFQLFFQSILGKYSRSRQLTALEAAYGMTSEELDVAWRKWIKKAHK